MTVKCYRTNTAFDLGVFLAQEARTPDGKYVFYTAQKNILEENLGNFKSAMMKKKTHFMRTERDYENLKNLINRSFDDEIRYIEVQAELLAISAGMVNDDLNMKAGQKEIDDLQKLVEAVTPFCKYTHLGLLEQQEVIQEEEWLLELIERAKENLLCNGTIPTDQFRAMKSHPQFQTAIVPAIRDFSTSIGGTVFSQVLALSLDERISLPPIDKQEIEHIAV